MGTAAQAWLEQGKAEGEAKGKAEGKAEGKVEGQADILLRMLDRRFGPLPQYAVGRVRAGTAEEIAAWADAVLDAPTLDAVLGGADN